MSEPIDWTRAGNRRLTCPNCGKGPRDRTLGVTVNGTKQLAHCFRCGLVERPGQDANLHLASASFASITDDKRETLSDAGLDFWNECVPLRGAGLAYLKARNTVIPPRDGDLRFHPELKHPSGYVGPALVGLVTHAEFGHAMSLHKTWIQANGDKARLDAPKLLLKGHQKAAGVIRLWPDDAVTHGLAIAEGIETALSIAHAFQPVWCVIDAGNMEAHFPPLPGVECLLIGADHDEAGIRAAHACAKRWVHAGREVRVVIPPTQGCDLNDIARAA